MTLAISAVLTKLRHITCVKHELLFKRDGSRVFTKCTHCGYETPGWHVPFK